MKNKLIPFLLVFVATTVWLIAATLPNLTSLGTVTDDDLLYVVDDPSGVPADRKITASTLSGYIMTAPKVGSVSPNLDNTDASVEWEDALALTASGALDIDSVVAANITDGQVGAAELASTTVTPGGYVAATITVDADGRITAAANGGSANWKDAGLTNATLSGTASVFNLVVTNEMTMWRGVTNSQHPRLPVLQIIQTDMGIATNEISPAEYGLSIEAPDALMLLVSTNEGLHAGTLEFKEVDAGAIVNGWAFSQLTTGSGQGGFMFVPTGNAVDWAGDGWENTNSFFFSTNGWTRVRGGDGAFVTMSDTGHGTATERMWAVGSSNGVFLVQSYTDQSLGGDSEKLRITQAGALTVAGGVTNSPIGSPADQMWMGGTNIAALINAVAGGSTDHSAAVDMGDTGSLTNAAWLDVAADSVTMGGTNLSTLINAAGGGTDDQVASEVPSTPAGNLAATDVQAALNELDSEKMHTNAVLATLQGLSGSTTNDVIKWGGSAWEVGEDGNDGGGSYLPLAGGTMSGDIDMDDNNITNINSMTVSYVQFPESAAPSLASTNNFEFDTTIADIHGLPQVFIDGTNYYTFAFPVADASFTDDYIWKYDAAQDKFVLEADATGGGTTMANDALWAVAGDLAYATANDVGAVLGIGTAGQFLQVNAGATAPQWSTFSSEATVATGGAVTLADSVSVATWTMTGSPGLTLANAATSAGVLRIDEDDDDGANFASFTVPALAANTVYTLPPDDGDAGEQLQTDGDGVLTWEAAGSGTGAFSDAGDPIVQNTTTKDVHVGDGAGTLAGKLEIGGDADQPQLVIEGFSTQTDSVLVVQNDADTEVFNVDNDGGIYVAGDIELGAAADTTIARSGAGDVTIEGNAVYRAGGTDVPVTDGGTGRSTGTTAYALVATGTTATGAQQTLASGATTEVLVGGGASALPVWTTASGTGAPLRQGSPTITGTAAIAGSTVGTSTVTNTIRVQQAVGNTTYVDLNKASATNSVSGTLTLVYATNGVAGAESTHTRWLLNGSGSDQTLAIPATWQTNALSAVPPAITNGWTTLMYVKSRGATSSGALQTNVFVSFEYYKVP